MYTVWYVYPRPIFRFLCLNFPKRWGGGPTPSPPNFLYIHVRASLLIINETKSKKHIMNTNRYINIYWHIEVLIILHWTYLNFDFPSKGWERKSCLWKEFIKTTIIVLVYTLDLTCMTRWKFSLNGQNKFWKYWMEIHSCIYVGLLNSVDLKRFKHISVHSQKQTQYICIIWKWGSRPSFCVEIILKHCSVHVHLKHLIRYWSVYEHNL